MYVTDSMSLRADSQEHSFMVGLGICFDMILIAYVARMWYLYYNNGYESMCCLDQSEFSVVGIDDEDIIDYRVPEESHYTVISSQPQTYYQTATTGPSYQSPTPQYYHPGYQQRY